MSQVAENLSDEPGMSLEKASARQGTVEAVRHKPFAGGKHDPSEMGKLGAKAKEAKALERIGEARGLMGQAAPRVARRAIRTALGHESGVTATEASMMRDVLDRTVGKAPTELRIGMADQTMQVLDMLELED